MRRGEPLCGRLGRSRRVALSGAERVHQDHLRHRPDVGHPERRGQFDRVRLHRRRDHLRLSAEFTRTGRGRRRRRPKLVDTIESDDRIERFIEASACNTAAGNNNATCFGKLASPCGTIRVPPHSTQIDGQSPSHLVPGKLRQLGPDLSQQTSQKDEWFV